MKPADIRKTIGNVLVGILAVAGQLTNASVVHGQGALWLAFGITVIQAVSHALVTYTVPNGATITQRVTALEQASEPVVQAVEAGVKDLHAGLSGPKGVWPTQSPITMSPVTLIPAASPPSNVIP